MKANGRTFPTFIKIYLCFWLNPSLHRMTIDFWQKRSQNWTLFIWQQLTAKRWRIMINEKGRINKKWQKLGRKLNGWDNIEVNFENEKQLNQAENVFKILTGERRASCASYSIISTPGMKCPVSIWSHFGPENFGLQIHLPSKLQGELIDPMVSQPQWDRTWPRPAKMIIQTLCKELDTNAIYIEQFFFIVVDMCLGRTFLWILC